MAETQPITRFRYRFVGPQDIYDLHPGRNLIGRYSYCEIHLQDPEISGEEGILDWHEEGLELSPLPGSHLSKDGKLLSGLVELHEGDVLLVGATPLRLVRREATISVSRVQRTIRRRRRFIWAVLALLILLIIGGALTLGARLLLNQERVKERVCEALSEKLHRSVEAGRAEVEVGGGRLIVTDLLIRDRAAFSLEPFVIVKRVEAEYSIGGLLFGGEWLRGISLKDAKLFLRRGEEGEINVSDLVRTLGNTAMSEDWPDVEVSGLSVAVAGRGNLRLDVKRFSLRERLNQTVLAMEGTGTGGLAFNMEGAFNTSGEATSGSAVLRADRVPLALLSAIGGVGAVKGTLNIEAGLTAERTIMLPEIRWDGILSAEGAKTAKVKGRAELDLTHGIFSIFSNVTGEPLNLEASADYDWQNGYLSAGVKGNASIRSFIPALDGRMEFETSVTGTSHELWKAEGSLSWLVPRDGGETSLRVSSEASINRIQRSITFSRFQTRGWCRSHMEEASRVSLMPFRGAGALRVDALDVGVLAEAMGFRNIKADEGVVSGTLALAERTFSADLDGLCRCTLELAEAGRYIVHGRIKDTDFKCEIGEGDWSITGKGGIPLGMLREVLSRGPGLEHGIPANLGLTGRIQADFFRASSDKEGLEVVIKGRGESLAVRSGDRKAALAEAREVVLNAARRTGENTITVRKLRITGEGLEADFGLAIVPDSGEVHSLKGRLKGDLGAEGEVADWLRDLLPFLSSSGRYRLTFESCVQESGGADVSVEGSLESDEAELSFQALLKGRRPDRWKAGSFKVEGIVQGGWLTSRFAASPMFKALEPAGPVKLTWTRKDGGTDVFSLSFDDAGAVFGREPTSKPAANMSVTVVLSPAVPADDAETGRPVLVEVAAGRMDARAVAKCEAAVLPEGVLKVKSLKVAGDAAVAFSLLPGIEEKVRLEGEVELLLENVEVFSPGRDSGLLTADASFRIQAAPLKIALPSEGGEWSSESVQGVLAFRGGKVTQSDLKLLPQTAGGREIAVNVEGNLDEGLVIYAAGGHKGLVRFLSLAVEALRKEGIVTEGLVRIRRGPLERPIVSGETNVSVPVEGPTVVRFTGRLLDRDVKNVPAEWGNPGLSVSVEQPFEAWPGTLGFLPPGRMSITILLESGAPLALFSLRSIDSARRTIQGAVNLDYPAVSLLAPPEIVLEETGPVIRGGLPLREGRVEFLPLGAAALAVTVYDGPVPSWLMVLGNGAVRP